MTAFVDSLDVIPFAISIPLSFVLAVVLCYVEYWQLFQAPRIKARACVETICLAVTLSCLAGLAAMHTWSRIANWKHEHEQLDMNDYGKYVSPNLKYSIVPLMYGHITIGTVWFLYQRSVYAAFGLLAGWAVMYGLVVYRQDPFNILAGTLTALAITLSVLYIHYPQAEETKKWFIRGLFVILVVVWQIFQFRLGG